jgi:hypothetical protein
MSTLEKNGLWADIAFFESPSFAPWRFTETTNYACSFDFSIKNGVIEGPELKKAEANTDVMFDEAPSACQALYETIKQIVNFCDDIIDHDEEFGPSKFFAIYDEMAKSVERGTFEIYNFLCYDEEYLVDLKFSPGKLEFKLHENEHSIWDEDED